MSFIARVMQYLANRFITERLANNHSFQQFAVRSVQKYRDVHGKGKEAIDNIRASDGFQNLARDAKSHTDRVRQGLKEVADDLKRQADRK